TSLFIYLGSVGPKMPQANVDPDADRKSSPPLIAGGVIAIVLGAAMAAVVWSNWDEVVRLTNPPPKKPAATQPATMPAPITVGVAPLPATTQPATAAGAAPA